jgi:predicted DNA-binding helix-hairpin-helix protein
MEKFKAIHLLSEHVNLESDNDFEFMTVDKKQQDAICVSKAQVTNGTNINLFKTLLSSACDRNCNYCPFHSGRDFRRAFLHPEDMAKVFISMLNAGIVQGLFLSSGITGSGSKTQDNLIACAEILRIKYNYTGYLHLKVMPGTEQAQIERCMQLADRISINLEAPNSERLSSLAPRKQYFDELIQPMNWITRIKTTKEARLGWNKSWPSMVTQFVVGAVGDTDKEILTTTDKLHSEFKLTRAYYSSFNPIPDTPFENLPPTSSKRQLRLYQASFLLRDYGFKPEELIFEETNNLDLSIDPKLNWAKLHLLNNPVEINKASKQVLLRVPGIGPKSVNTIQNYRLKNVISKPE